MRRDQVRADLRHYLHCDEVKEMTRFAVEVGIRGAMLRELRFKWAREKLEEVEFYRGLDDMRTQAEAAADPVPALPPPRVTSLPRRKGEVKYQMYGLDMSDPKWAEVAERTAEAEAHFVPAEAKAVDGKAKKAEERLLSVNPRKGDPVPAMEEWKEELRPKRVDWMALLERVKARNVELYLKVAETLLAEESFDANIRDYSKLIDLYSKANNVEGAERILSKMKEKSIAPDILTSIILVHMYSKAGNLEQAKEAFEFIRKEGFKPDLKLFSSMINCYINHGEPVQAESLIKSMSNMGIKPTREMYTDVMRAFAQRGMVDAAQRVHSSMTFAGIQPTAELFTLRIEAYGRSGDADSACSVFEQMRKSGHEPDDSSIAGVMAAYMKRNKLDQALNWLLGLEKDGFKPGVKTNLVLLDWLSMLQLVLEAEQLVQKIKNLGEEPVEVHVFLADMYAKLRQEEKVRKSLKILEDKKKMLKAAQFERIIRGLLDGGFSEEANKYYKMMKACGFEPSETIEVGVKASLGVRGGPRPTGRHRG
uniref:PROP1-like PPR domain-containing protein n=1 Tax=Arundo donax TaxID=35708 RepID=A0A0A9GIM7_ARUDO